MDKDKRRERHQDRWVSTHRVRFASWLGANGLKVGTGVSFCVLSCGLIDGLAIAAHGQDPVPSNANPPASEIRLKSIGEGISLRPISSAGNATPSAVPLRPHPSKIQLDPMTGNSTHGLDQPVFIGVNPVPNVAATAAEDVLPNHETADIDTPRLCPVIDSCDDDAGASVCEPSDHPSHPRILSMRLLDQDAGADHPDRVTVREDSATEDVRVPLARVIEPQVESPRSILESSSGLEPSSDIDAGWEAEQAVSFSFSDAASDPAADPEEIANLPLLPVPNGQWVAAETVVSLSDSDMRSNGGMRGGNTGSNVDRREHPAAIEVPSTISAARVEGLSTHLPRATVPAKFAGYVRPTPPATRHQGGVTRTMDSTVLMMNEIQEHYPDAQVVLTHSDNRLVVRGNCGDRNQATAIIRLIRSRHLIPVDDQLVIR